MKIEYFLNELDYLEEINDVVEKFELLQNLFKIYFGDEWFLVWSIYNNKYLADKLWQEVLDIF